MSAQAGNPRSTERLPSGQDLRVLSYDRTSGAQHAILISLHASSEAAGGGNQTQVPVAGGSEWTTAFSSNMQSHWADMPGQPATECLPCGGTLAVPLNTFRLRHGDRNCARGHACLSVAEAVTVYGATPVYLHVGEYLCIEPEETLRHDVGSLAAVILRQNIRSDRSSRGAAA